MAWTSGRFTTALLGVVLTVLAAPAVEAQATDLFTPVAETPPAGSLDGRTLRSRVVTIDLDQLDHAQAAVAASSGLATQTRDVPPRTDKRSARRRHRLPCRSGVRQQLSGVGYPHQRPPGCGATADLAMLPVQVVQNFQPENDAGIQLEGQTVVSVLANSLVTASGNAVTGEATAMVTVLDPSRDAAVMPGELVRWNTETGTTGEIESFGAMNVVFADANGERLNLASGKQAGISIPLAEGRRPEDAPATIPLFYWSDTRGY